MVVASSTGFALMSTLFFFWYVWGCSFLSQIGGVLMSVLDYYLYERLLLWRIIQFW